MTAYIIEVRQGSGRSAHEYVKFNAHPFSPQFTGLIQLSKQFSSMTEAALFALWIEGKTEILPVSAGEKQ